MPPAQKNIVIITHHYPPHITGVGFVAQKQAEQLTALGHSVTVITSNTAPDEKTAIVNGVRVIRVKALNMSENWGAPFPLFSPTIIFPLLRYIRSAHIVHIHDTFYLSSFLGALIAKFYGKAIVLTQHVAIVAHPNRLIMGIQKLVYSTTGALIFRLSNRILVYNNIVKDFLINDLALDAHKVIELRNGVDLDMFHPASGNEKDELRAHFNLPKDKPLVLFVGRLVHKKGFTKLLAAQDSAYDIVFAGPGKATDVRLKAPGIHVLGSMNQEELSKLYRAADIFVFPGEGEMFTLTIQEALASGLPVIATDEPGYSKYAVDRNLLTFIQPTPEELKRTIKRILDDPEMRARMSAYSAQLAKEWFNYKNTLTVVTDLYSEILTTKKKIAIITDAVYLFNKGGKEKRIYDISTRLATQGNDVTIYCMKWWYGSRTISSEGVTYYAISPYFPLYIHNRRSIKQAFFFALHCFKLINKKFDIIEIDHVPHLVLFTTKIICVLRRKRMLVTWHEVWGEEYWKKYLGTKGILAFWIERLSAMLPDVIISVSAHTTSALRTILKVNKPIVTIDNGLDIASIVSLPPAEKGADILFAGRLLSHKNVDALLRASALLMQKDPTLRTWIIGEGPEKAPLIALAQELGIANNVVFMDFLPDHHELYRIMHASRVFVLPSTREGFGIVVLEANAAGLPVVTITHPDNAACSLIADGKNGVLSSLIPEELAEAIQKAFALKAGNSNYVSYIQKYNWDTIISGLTRVYDTPHE